MEKRNRTGTLIDLACRLMANVASILLIALLILLLAPLMIGGRRINRGVRKDHMLPFRNYAPKR